MFVVMDKQGRYYAQTRLGNAAVVCWWSKWRHDAKRFPTALDAYDVSNLEGTSRTEVVQVPA